MDIRDFWTVKETIQDKEVLKKYAREYYTNDFIDNYEKWKNNLKDINAVMQEHLKSYMPDFISAYWQDMTFDHFCKSINDNIEECIERTGNISPEDIFDVSQELIHKYLVKIMQDMDEKTLTLNQLLEAIKKVVIL